MWKVIIIEDEPLTRQGIMMTVDWKHYGAMIVGDAGTAEDGLSLIRKHQPDIIITDIRMGEMTGIEMLTQARKEGSEAEFIVISAYSDFAYAQQALRAGAAEYLLKPFAIEELEEAVATVIGHLEKRNRRPDSEIEELLPIRQNLSKGAKNKYVELALDYIEEHYVDPDLTISDIAEALEISEGYLSRMFRKETEYTLVNYLTRYRLREAAKRLTDIRVKVYEVAYQVGYLDTAYFSALFKRFYGMTPSEYQERSG
jgi:two-component system response regulator YesN